ncbi:MAG: S-methyl-5-thioribose-1-phosphate isomerase [Melioribacteraceae bacterium]|nr:S-methyl-5-thioribose-1-phosphate isomerase [Melioribacteraceae bacterium]
MNIEALHFKEGYLHILDQIKLPFSVEYIITDDYEIIASAIERLSVRGAPAIGIAAAYALALSVKNVATEIENKFYTAYKRIAKTRPTAVNLFYAIDRMKKLAENRNHELSYNVLLEEAIKIHNEDIALCDGIAETGLKLFTKKMRIITHCNTGALATGGGGTALNVIKKAFQNNLVEIVYADETRPLFQGSRLTAFELAEEGIPFKIITDSTAAFLFKNKLVDIVITGADRIAANGDSANKIGTYNLAVLCSFHNIPFYIAAPSTTIDKKCSTGNDILIEERDKSEINSINDHRITLDHYHAFTPAFDVTPCNLITGIITESNIYSAPYNFNHV